MNNKLTVQSINGVLMVDSFDISKLLSLPHMEIQTIIEGYIDNLAHSNYCIEEFFVKKITQSGKYYFTLYDITLKGCDLVKGSLDIEKKFMFEQMYTNAFNNYSISKIIEPVEIIETLPVQQEVITPNNSEIKCFDNGLFGQVRFVEINGKPYAVGSDVATALGYAKPRNAISQHCKGALKQGVLSNGGMQEMSVIPEGDIYRLIVKSKLPGAERFETWVFDEVLPQIRMTGGYIQTTEEDTPETIMAKALIVAQKTLDNKDIRF